MRTRTPKPCSPQEQADPLSCLLHSHPETAFDYLEFRRLLAGQAAAFAAERASDEDVARLRQSLTEMEKAHALDDPEQEAQADAQFHLICYEMSGNQVMIHIMRRLFEMLKSGVFYDRADLYLRRGVREGFLRQHQAIYAAIAARNPDAARAAADAHLATTAETLREAQRADSRREVALRRRDGVDLMAPARSRG
ncbi:FCD domain-containing protein [Magnetospirillum aberrantis]|uniref:FCD domain-containing protein n=1 Tax=Magnetospirillum aberrantis SpK TaxID=908842 RepID=A0A7C9UT35_9PROT|nr:FCD domain-containing protein [Magnetospirillum aberrantis]NFV79748.1 FCD domain-containing protein [Magnetospirillum aberrantis SpK]